MTLVLFGILPGIVALGIIVISVRSIIRAVSVTQLALGIPAVLTAIWSLLVLERIFLEAAWPTFLPHIAIVVISPLAAIQWHLARGRGSDVVEKHLLIIGLVLLMVSVPPLALLAREIAGTRMAAKRYFAEHIHSREAGAGGALRAEIGGHVAALEDDQRVDTNGDSRVEGTVRILIDGRDYSTNSPVEIRLNSRDANRYWGYVYLMKMLDRHEGTQQLVVAQSLRNGRYRTLTLSMNGSVAEDEFSYHERCNPPVRAIVIDSVTPSPSRGLCSADDRGWAAVIRPVIYPWTSFALGLACLIDAVVAQRRRRGPTRMRPK